MKKLSHSYAGPVSIFNKPVSIAQPTISMPPYYHRQNEKYLLSTDPELLDFQVIHTYLSKTAYWSQNIPMETVQRAARNSIVFGIYHSGAQVGYARIISDRATFAYLADVFILPEHRGKGLSKWLLQCIHDHPDLQGLRRWMLATADAHGLYEKFGWQVVKAPDRWMEQHFPDVYQKVSK